MPVTSVVFSWQWFLRVLIARAGELEHTWVSTGFRRAHHRARSGPLCSVCRWWVEVFICMVPKMLCLNGGICLHTLEMNHKACARIPRPTSTILSSSLHPFYLIPPMAPSCTPFGICGSFTNISEIWFTEFVSPGWAVAFILHAQQEQYHAAWDVHQVSNLCPSSLRLGNLCFFLCVAVCWELL